MYLTFKPAESLKSTENNYDIYSSIGLCLTNRKLILVNSKESTD